MNFNFKFLGSSQIMQEELSSAHDAQVRTVQLSASNDNHVTCTTDDGVKVCTADCGQYIYINDQVEGTYFPF